MKTKALFFVSCLLLLAGSACAKKPVKGNGNVVTKQISISDYNEISTAGVLEFVYEQTDGEPYLEVQIDENLFPLLKIEVKGDELKVYPKQTKGDLTKVACNLEPTVFKVVSRSRTIEEINVASSGNFVVASPLNINKLEIDMAGSGSVIMNKEVKGKELEVNMAGSGSVVASNVSLREVECNLAGSGFVRMSGSADEAEYNVAGSGDIKAYGCVTGKAECNVAGSGSIEVYAKDRLNASLVSSGKVCYKGNPTIEKSVIGLGKLKNAN